jgi:hypothetical protein
LVNFVFFPDVSEAKKCRFLFPRNGLEFLEHLLPQKVSVVALQCKVTGGDHIPGTHSSVWQAMGTGTLADVVVNQGCLIAEDICLKLFVLQVFRYNKRLLCPVSVCMLDAAVDCTILGG